MNSVFLNAFGFSVIYFIFLIVFPVKGMEVTLINSVPYFICIFLLSLFVQYFIKGFKSEHFNKKEQK